MGVLDARRQVRVSLAGQLAEGVVANVLLSEVVRFAGYPPVGVVQVLELSEIDAAGLDGIFERSLKPETPASEAPSMPWSARR